MTATKSVSNHLSVVRRIFSSLAVIHAFFFLSLVSVESLASKRTALVIGNSNYQSVPPLKNPVRDAKAMSQSLRSVGFDVIDAYDLDQAGMYKAIKSFGEKLEQGGVGLFFFAGHGVNVAKSNFLIPLGANIESDTEVPYKAVNVDLVLDTMAQADNPLNIVILDACRDNPFAGSSRSASRGLARLATPRGTLIAYATAEGQTAEDGSGENGTYTKHLLEQMMTPNQPVELMFKNVREGVRKETNGRQTPMEQSSLIGHFSFLTTENATQRIGGITASIDAALLAQPVTESVIQKTRGLYKQLESLSSDHAYLQDKNDNLAKLHERFITRRLENPTELIDEIDRVERHFHQLSILDPDNKVVKDKDALLASAYLFQADKLHRKGNSNAAIATLDRGYQLTQDQRLATRKASFGTNKKQTFESPSTQVAPEVQVSSIPIRYRLETMNCVKGNQRFSKTKKKIIHPKKGVLLVKEVVNDACQNLTWAYTASKKNYKGAKKLCQALGKNWRLASKDNLISLITEERYPGQGGMMNPKFFPADNAIGPQEVYWSADKEGRKHFLVNAMNGTVKDTYNATKIGSVICISDS